jgi:hypothetical protein
LQSFFWVRISQFGRLHCSSRTSTPFI